MAAGHEAQQPVQVRAARLVREARLRAGAAAVRVRATLLGAAGAARGRAARASAGVAEALSTLRETYAITTDALCKASCIANEKAALIASETKTKSVALTAATKKLAADPTVQVTSVSAATGAMAVGTGGAAVGLASGGLLGAALGLVPAAFTFGLSVPLFAALGAGAGCVTGAVSGGSLGLVGGGAVGYGAYSKRERIGDVCISASRRARGLASSVAERVGSRASTSASMVRERSLGAQASAKAFMSAARARLTGGRGEDLCVATASQ